MPMSQRKYVGQYRQRGAFSIMAAGSLMMALLCLVLVVDSGRLYMEQRSLQRVADMAALETVSRGGFCRDGSTTAYDFAHEAATRNKLFQQGGELDSVQCVDLGTNEQGLREVISTNVNSQSIRVVVAKTTPASLVFRARCLFTACDGDGNIRLKASAVAGREQPIAAFSVGSRLIRFDSDSGLGSLVKFVGLDLDGVNVADYTGLVNLPITPDGLLRELELPITTDLTVGGLNDLLAARKVNVLELIEAAATVVGQDALLDLGLDIIDAVESNLEVSSLELTLPLLTQPDGTPGLFAEIIAPDTQNAGAALNTQLSALSLLETAIGIATHEHALSVDSLSLNLLGLVDVTTQVGVVEPPSITIGAPTKRDASGTIVQEGAEAYTAQVRTYIHVQAGQLMGAVNSLLSLLLGADLIHINLPIALDLVTGKGALEENTCTPSAAAQTGNPGDHAEITASGKIGALCIGLPQHENQLFSKYESCDRYMTGTKYLDILGLLKLDRTGGSPLSLDLLDIPKTDVYLSVDEDALPSDWAAMQGRTDFATVGSNSLNAGTLAENIVSRLLDLLVGQSNISAANPEQNKYFAQTIWDSVAPMTCGSTNCRRKKMEDIEELVEKDNQINADGLVSGLLVGVLDLLDGLLGLVIGNGCTSSGLLGSTSDMKCVQQLADALPSNNTPTPKNHLGLGILKDSLDAVGNSILRPLLENLLGLHVSEVDVHLQDLNCGHARLLL